MEVPQEIINIVLKAFAVGMSVSSIIFGIVGLLGTEVQITFLGVGLAAVAIASLAEE